MFHKNSQPTKLAAAKSSELGTCASAPRLKSRSGRQMSVAGTDSKIQSIANAAVRRQKPA